MTKNFVERIIREGIVDSRKYRYTCFENFGEIIIKRIPLIYLDTTAVYDGWEYVKRISL